MCFVVNSFPLAAGEAYGAYSGGGSGKGDPHLRPIAKVLFDVQAGYVSREQARSRHGVVIRAVDEEHWEVDVAETQRLRATDVS